MNPKVIHIVKHIRMKNRRGISFLFILMNLGAYHLSAQDAAVDSLKQELKYHKADDTTKANLYIALCKVYSDDVFYKNKVELYAPSLMALSMKLDYKKGIAYGYLYTAGVHMEKRDLFKALAGYFEALRMFKQQQDKYAISTCLHRIGLTKTYQEKYEESIQYMLKAGKMREEMGLLKEASNSYNNAGNAYANLGKFVEALTYFFKSLKAREAVHDSIGISVSYLNIGNTLFEQHKLDESINYLSRALKPIEKGPDTRLKAVIYSNMGSTYSTQKKYQLALIYCLKSLRISEEIGDKTGMVTGYINMADNYASQHKLAEALNYFQKAEVLCEELQDQALLIETFNGLGRCYEQKENYEDAQNYYTKALNISKEINYRTGILDAYNNMSSINEKLKNFQKSLEYHKLYGNLKDKLLNEESLKQTAELNARYETDKKEKEIQLLTKDQQLKDKSLKEQRLVRIGLIIGLGLFLALSFLLFNRYRFKQKANLLLEKQKQEIQQKNVLITDSIDYAKTIQEAILPDDEKLNATFPECFILYKPKAIVSGDFYWIGKKDNKIICAVADCTGHGVPGAFMSLLGHNILENVIQRDTSTDPGAILTSLNQEIVARFSNGEEQYTVKHGMDIAIISIDSLHQQLQYAGARNSLYLLRENKLIEIKADRMTTGIVNRDRTTIEYTNNSMGLQKGDMLYLFSDGFPDQKGGPDKKKFYYQPFKDLLTTISNLPVEEQKQKLNDTIMNWMGTGEQIDDILVMGIRC
jgi:serine phosphatase RsbU (regulator of sigma subunit)